MHVMVSQRTIDKLISSTLAPLHASLSPPRVHRSRHSVRYDSGPGVTVGANGERYVDALIYAR